MFTYDAIVSRGYEESMTQALGTKFTQDGSKFEQTAPRGAQTQNFYTCSGRFPAITTIKDIHPYGTRSKLIDQGCNPEVEKIRLLRS